jgi:myosin heavy subunit
VEGTIRSVGASSLTITEQSTERDIKDVAALDVALWDPEENLAALIDFAHLRHLTPASVTYALQQRYASTLPYTMVGERMLVYINPYKYVAPSPSLPCPKAIAARALAELAASIARHSDDALAPVDEGAKPKATAVLVTGTSGAGKTEAIKMVMAEIVRRCSAGVAGISSPIAATAAAAGTAATRALDVMRRINGAHAILESFGNAVTPHNTNSSRFTKLVDLRLRQTDTAGASGENVPFELDGASISCYLLESSRLVSRGPGESNFHVLYALFDGLDTERRTEFDLWDVGLFAALTSDSVVGQNAQTPQANDFVVCAPPFSLKQITDALVAIGFSVGDVTVLYRILAAVLHLQNIVFAANDDFSAARVSSDPKSSKALRQAAMLLCVPWEDLQATLTALTLSINNQTTKQNYNRATAKVCRDTLAKSLYAAVFSHIVARLNAGLAEATTSAATGSKRSQQPTTLNVQLLDVFGFETAPTDGFNGLEQLLINTANEALQNLFDTQVLQAFDDELEREGVSGGSPAEQGAADASGGAERQLQASSASTYAASPALEALTKKAGSVLSVIADESMISRQGMSPAAAAESLCEKVFELMPKHPLALKRPKVQRDANNPTFVIQHYADAVAYSTADMAAKNRLLPSIGPKLAQTCTHPMIVELLNMRVSPIGFGTSANAATTTTTQRTVQGPTALATAFRDQMDALLQLLKPASLYWIRCIKPNSNKAPDSFATPLVEAQLSTGGIYYGLHQLGRGLSVRYSHRQFAGMGLCMLPIVPEDDLAACRFKSVAQQIVKHLARVASRLDEPEDVIQRKQKALRDVRVGVSRVFLSRPAAAVFRELLRSQHLVVGGLLTRVAHAFTARQALGHVRSRKLREEAAQKHQARLHAERPIRLELEKQRLQREYDATGSLATRLAHNRRRLRHGAKLLAATPQVLERLSKELRRACAEIALADSVRLEKEAMYEERAKYLVELQRAAAEKASREADEKQKSEWGKQMAVEEKRRAMDKIAATERDAAAREEHLRRLFAAARLQQSREAQAEEAAAIEERRRRHALSDRHWVGEHLNRAQRRISNEVELKRAAEVRSSVAHELLTRSAQRARGQAGGVDESRAKLTDLLGPDTSAVLLRSGHRSVSEVPVPYRERGGSVGAATRDRSPSVTQPPESHTAMGLNVSTQRGRRPDGRASMAALHADNNTHAARSLSVLSADAPPSDSLRLSQLAAMDDRVACPPATHPAGSPVRGVESREHSITMTDRSEIFWQQRRAEWEHAVRAAALAR